MDSLPVMQDKDRRQKMLMQKPEPVPNKLCSRCNTHKTCEEFYRDASKPDGLQVLHHTPLIIVRNA